MGCAMRLIRRIADLIVPAGSVQTGLAIDSVDRASNQGQLPVGKCASSVASNSHFECRPGRDCDGGRSPQLTPILTVRDLHVYFRTSDGMLHAVKGIDFDVREGE